MARVAKPKEPTKKVLLEVPERIGERLRDKCKYEGRPMNNYILALIMDNLYGGERISPYKDEPLPADLTPYEVAEDEKLEPCNEEVTEAEAISEEVLERVEPVLEAGKVEEPTGEKVAEKVVKKTLKKK